MKVRIIGTTILQRESCLIAESYGLFADQRDQQRLACSVGVSPTGAEVRSPVVWIAPVEETKPVKPIDKAIFGMVSESPGRNVSEPIGGLDRKKFRGLSPLLKDESSTGDRNLTDAIVRSGGVVGAAR